jgi:hypothetical protein
MKDDESGQTAVDAAGGAIDVRGWGAATHVAVGE